MVHNLLLLWEQSVSSERRMRYVSTLHIFYSDGILFWRVVEKGWRSDHRNSPSVNADLAVALSTEALKGTWRSTHPFIHGARPHSGQRESAHTIFSLLSAVRTLLPILSSVSYQSRTPILRCQMSSRNINAALSSYHAGCCSF